MKTITFWFYNKTGIIANIIKYRTVSDYSHVSIELSNDRVTYEALGGSFFGVGEGEGVVKSKSPFHFHQKKLKAYQAIHLPVTDQQYNAVKEFLENQVGKQYDYAGILNFMTKTIHQKQSDWFCSELGSQALFIATGFRGTGKRISPEKLLHQLTAYLQGFHNATVSYKE